MSAEESQSPRCIALFTDFGSDGFYQGQLQAALLGIRQPVIDLLSTAPMFNPRASAHLLAALAEHMPEGTLFLAVVDPGVGSDRLPLILRTASQWFVGPDNGLFSQLARRHGNARARTIDWRPEHLSQTFHGRDLFAPVAARICQGEPVEGRDLALQNLVGADWPDQLQEIIHVDHYGNLITGIPGESLERERSLQLGSERLAYAGTFSRVPPQTPFWYINSLGLVEIAVNQGSAAERLSLGVGARIGIL